MAVSNSEKIQLSHKRSFEVLFSKNHGNICSDIAAVVWEKIPLISISNGPVIIHSTINDASTPDKQTGGLLEAKQPIEIVLEKIRKETFQLLIPKTHSYEKSNEGPTEQKIEIYKLKNILSHPIERLQISTFAAAGSLVQMGQTNINIANIYKTQEAEWFNCESVVRQVLDYKHMVRLLKHMKQQ